MAHSSAVEEVVPIEKSASPTSSNPGGVRNRNRSRNWGSRVLPVLGLLPIGAYYAVLFGGAVGLFLAFSFYRFENYDFVPDFQFGNYRETVGNDIYRSLLVHTIAASFCISIVVVAISYAFVYLINFVFPKQRQWLYFLVLVSLFSGYLVRIYAWRTILGAQGVVNSALMDLGLLDEPLRFLLNGWFAVGLALTNFMIPLAVLPLNAAMGNVSPKTLEAARDLGAGRFAVHRRVLLPLVRRAVLVAFAFVFIGTAADFVTPSLLGGVDAQMIGNAVQTQFGATFNWPLGSALSFTLIAVVLAVVGVFAGLMKLITK